MANINIQIEVAIAGNADARYNQPAFSYRVGQIVSVDAVLAGYWIASGTASAVADGGGSPASVYSLAPAPDGFTVAFTAEVAIAANALVVKNGQIKTPGAGKDYTVSGITITFAVAPLSSDSLMLYQ